MDPESDELVRFLELSWLGQEQTLEDVCQMPDIELIMEVDGCFSECYNYTLM